MKTLNRVMKSLLATVAAAGLLLTATAADAGRGSSYGRILSAIDSGGTDTIMAELEQAENLICTACVAPVMALLHDDRYEVRQVAAWWFARRPAQAKEITELAKGLLLIGTSDEVRNGADWLGTFNRPSAIDELGTALTRGGLQPDARVAITRAIGEIANPVGNQFLARAMTDSNADVRRQAILSWKLVRQQFSATPVIPLLNDTDALVRSEAAGAIGQARDQAGRASLEAALRDSDPRVRRNAAWALYRIGGRDSLSALQTAMTTETSPLVKGFLRRAISN